MMQLSNALPHIVDEIFGRLYKLWKHGQINHVNCGHDVSYNIIFTRGHPFLDTLYLVLFTYVLVKIIFDTEYPTWAVRS